MNYKLNKWYGYTILSIISSIAIVTSSCESYKFAKPQPADKTNIYEFPAEFLGKWIECDTGTYNFDVTIPFKEEKGLSFTNRNENPERSKKANQDEDDTSFYYITKKYVLLVLKQTDKIVTGAWPKLTTGKEFIYPPDYIRKNYTQQTIHYDSLKKPIDTVDNYIFNKGKIYERNSDGFLEKGYNYTVEKDTIFVQKYDSIYIDLGQNALLRKLNDELYVFNIRNLGIDGDNENWWMVLVLQKKDKNTFLQWELTEKAGTLPCMFYKKDPKSKVYYFDCEWSSFEIIQLLKNGYFSESVFTKISN